MRDKFFRNVIWTIFILVGLEIVSLLVGLFSSLGYGESFRVVFGSVFVLFLPGWVWTFVFFGGKGLRARGGGFSKGADGFGGCVGSGFSGEREKQGIDIIERVALSFALSIAIVPLAMFYLNLIGLSINALNSFLVVLGIVIIGIGVVWFRKKSIGLEQQSL
ncbi:MAG: DUF1616 domain-containing protein [Nanoarchaeota archaeon]|nr:DUF1616 domain-containing protein [Nanoarchaeota archaeon]MBU1051262.1 DUF1616 domain-containing protein [Nanoarchaeota archaeon]MBU1988618.1 DUF1616 domain-containing protein [Nanoarchaeota archaeon]